MRIRSLDSAHDWSFGQGKQNYSREAEALHTNVITRLLSFRTDCFYAEAEGVDYFNFLAPNTKDLLDQDIKRVIMQTDGVTDIPEYESVLGTEERNLTVTATISTIYGNIGVEVAV